MSVRQDQEFGSKAVQKGIISVSQLSECLKILNDLQEQGKNIPLQRLLIARGHITPKEATRLEKNLATESTCAKNFGRYEIFEEIGHGGMGKVYRAYDPKMQRQIALKVLLGGEMANKRDVERFIREVKITARLNHPNIVAIHDVNRERGQHFFTMDFIRGVTLQKLIEEMSVSKRQLVDIMIAVARALHQAHLEGIVHRDIKPANIMVDENNKPVLMDFGLAKSAHDSKKLSHTGIPLGTLHYMPPEQAEGRHKLVDERSDVYALGATLYHALCGRPPFVGKTPMEIFKYIQSENPVSPSKIRQGIPKALEIISLKALDKDKRRRYQSAAAMADDLLRFKQGETIIARPRNIWQRLSLKAKRYRALVVVAGLFALSVLFLLVHSHMQIRAEVVKTHMAEEQARLERDRACEMAVQARAESKNARASEIKVRISVVEALLSEAESHIASIVTLVGTSQDYCAAKQRNEQVIELCRKCDATLRMLSKSVFLTTRLQKRCKKLQNRSQELALKSRHIKQYQLLLNSSELVESIPFPTACIPFEHAKNCWQYTVLSINRQKLRNTEAAELKKAMMSKTDRFGNQAVVVWDMCNKTIVRIICHPQPVRYTAFSHNGRYLAIGDVVGGIVLWDRVKNSYKTGKMPEIADGNQKITSIAFSFDSSLLAVATYTHIAIFQRSKLDKRALAILPYGGKYVALQFSPDGQWLVTGGLATQVVQGRLWIGGTRLWETGNWQEIKHIEQLGQKITISTGNIVALGARDNIILWDIRLKREKILEGHRGETIGIDYSRNGRFLASLGDDQLVMVRNAYTGKRIVTLPVPKSDARDIAFSPDNLLGVWAKESFNIYRLDPLVMKILKAPEKLRKIIDLSENHGTALLTKENSGISASFSNRLVGSYSYSFIFLWDIKSGKLLYPSNDSRMLGLLEATKYGQIKQINFSRDNAYLACIARSSLRIIDVAKKEQAAWCNTSGDCVEFCPTDNRLIAVGNGDGLEFLSYVPNSLQQFALEKIGNVKALCFSQDGSLLATGGSREIRVWRISPLRIIPGREKLQKKTISKLKMENVQAVCFSPEGLAAGSENCRFILWDWKNGRKIDEARMPAPIVKIMYESTEKLYWIITGSSVFIYRPTGKEKINIYPLEIYPGYKKSPVSLSKDCRHMTFFGNNLELLHFDLPAPLHADPVSKSE